MCEAYWRFAGVFSGRPGLLRVWWSDRLLGFARLRVGNANVVDATHKFLEGLANDVDFFECDVCIV